MAGRLARPNGVPMIDSMGETGWGETFANRDKGK